MKEGFDREIDSLLQRRARGTAQSRLWGDGPGDGAHAAHLDADELGAFAEGALPAAARLAAVSHLADCERCRGVVVGLARVAGAEREVKQHAVAVTASEELTRTPAWRAFVATLFAPRVLRYAAPVLALSLVGVLSYVALRSNSVTGPQLAKQDHNRTTVMTKAPEAPAQATAEVSADPAGLIGQNTNAAAGETAVPPASHRGHGAADAQPSAEADAARADAAPPVVASAPPPPSAGPVAEGPVATSGAAPQPVTSEEGESAKAEDRERYETREKSARAAEPAADLALNDASVQQRRAAQSRANEVQMPDGGSRNQQKRSADNNASGNYGNVAGAGAATKESEREPARSRSEALSRPRAARPAERKGGEDETGRGVETRTAAGRRFRREGSAWVDVNYKPSMPSTGVRRGTDAFRALVADVPEVGRVAAAIGGEVVVVVNGRAYRIR